MISPRLSMCIQSLVRPKKPDYPGRNVVYPASLRETRQVDLTELYKLPRQHTISGFSKYSFFIPGLGKSGENCGCQRLTSVSSDMKFLKNTRLACKRAECPDCWSIWAKYRAFEITMALEIVAQMTQERPKSWFVSVNPDKVSTEAWSWTNINTHLFRRGYRRSKSHGMKGGQAFYHPFRIKPEIKILLRKERKSLWKSRPDLAGKYKGEVGFWRMVRNDLLDLKSFFDYVNFGPHVHMVGFGSPKQHISKDFMLQFQDDTKGKPLPLKDVQSVVGKVIYLLSHTGLIRDPEFINFNSRPTRRFGVMCRMSPEMVDRFPSMEWLEDKALEVANALSMTWDADNGLHLKTDHPVGEDIVWVPLRHVKGLLADWEPHLPEDVVYFYRSLDDHICEHGLPPPDVFLCYPDGVKIIGELPSKSVEEIVGCNNAE